MAVDDVSLIFCYLVHGTLKKMLEMCFFFLIISKKYKNGVWRIGEVNIGKTGWEVKKAYIGKIVDTFCKKVFDAKIKLTIFPWLTLVGPMHSV